MTNHEMTRSLDMGHQFIIYGEPNPTLCTFALGVHATLTEMAKHSGWFKSIVLRAVAGWITDWRKENGCP